MMDGIYSIVFRGAVDWGIGMLMLRKGSIVGMDAGGIAYDGAYKETGQEVTVDLKMTIPPGATLVQGGQARPQTYVIEFKKVVPKSAVESGKPVLFDLPQGPVNVIFRLLRSIHE